MKKKESIIDVLKNGTSRTEKSLTEIVNGNFSCVFPKGEDVKIFADSLKMNGLSINEPALRATHVKKALPDDVKQAIVEYMADYYAGLGVQWPTGESLIAGVKQAYGRASDDPAERDEGSPP